MTPDCDITPRPVSTFKLDGTLIEYLASPEGCIWEDEGSGYTSASVGVVKVTNTSDTPILIDTLPYGGLIFGNLFDVLHPEVVREWARPHPTRDPVEPLKITLEKGEVWTSEASLIHPTLTYAMPNGLGLNRAPLPLAQHFERVFRVSKQTNFGIFRNSQEMQVPKYLTSDIKMRYILPEPELEKN